MNEQLVLNNAINGYRSLARGRLKGALRNFEKVYTEGIEQPAQTKLLINAGKAQARKDALSGNLPEDSFPVFPLINMYISSALLRFNKKYRTLIKQFNIKYEELCKKQIN